MVWFGLNLGYVSFRAFVWGVAWVVWVWFELNLGYVSFV